MGNNSDMGFRWSNCLLIDILCNEFGHEKVYQALSFKHNYQAFKRENPHLVAESFNTLSLQWQRGKSREYLESLAEEVQYSIICYLAENYINDKTRADCVLTEV